MGNVSQVGNVPDDAFISRAENAAQLAEDAATAAAAAQAAAEQALADTLAALAAQNIGDHNDTTLSALVANDLLRWNGAAWINAQVSLASLADVAPGANEGDLLSLVGGVWTPASPAAVSGAVPLAGGTMTGPLILSGAPTVANGAATKAYVDGLAGLTVPYDFGIFRDGIPVDNENFLRFISVRSFRMVAGLGNSSAISEAAATAPYVISIRRNGIQVGTMTWAAAGTVATLAMASDQTFAAGDTLDLIGQATTDATIEDIQISLRASLT